MYTQNLYKSRLKIQTEFRIHLYIHFNNYNYHRLSSLTNILKPSSTNLPFIITLKFLIDVPVCLLIFGVFIPNFFGCHLNKDFAYVVKLITQYAYSGKYVYYGAKSILTVLEWKTSNEE